MMPSEMVDADWVLDTLNAMDQLEKKFPGPIKPIEETVHYHREIRLRMRRSTSAEALEQTRNALKGRSEKATEGCKPFRHA